MRDRAIHGGAGLILTAVILSIPAIVHGQTVEPRYRVLGTTRTSTMQRELQEAADSGYRLVEGQGSWILSAVLEKGSGELEPVEYLLLATSKTGTLQDEMNRASAQGYRFASVLGAVGREVVIAMQRKKGQTTRTHEHRLLATLEIKTLERELLVGAVGGFRFVGQTVFDRSFVGRELVAILERPVQR